MAENLAFGIASFEIADIDPLTGLALAGTLASIGDIYQDSCELMEADPELTKIFAEQKQRPVKVLVTPGDKTIKLSLLDTSADALLRVFGGTITTVSLVKTWNQPKKSVIIEKFVKITTQDGYIITIPRGSLSAKQNFKFAKKGVLLLDVMIEVTEPKIATLPAMSCTDPV